jgi:hypothetical protein
MPRQNKRKAEAELEEASPEKAQEAMASDTKDKSGDVAMSDAADAPAALVAPKAEVNRSVPAVDAKAGAEANQAKPEAAKEAKGVEVKTEGAREGDKVKAEGDASAKTEVKTDKKEEEAKQVPKPRVCPEALNSDKILGALLPFVRDPSMATVSKLWAGVVRNSVAFWGVVSGRGKRCNDTTIAQLAANKGWIIHTFDLEDCKHIGDNALRAIAKVDKLEGVNLLRCQKITDEAIIDMAKMSPTLKVLKIAFCVKLSDACVLAVADNCPDLEVLNLDCCTNITDESIMAIADKCPKLKSLGVGNCSGVTDASILKIVANCLNMENLNISCTPQNDSSVVAIAKACPKLKR